MVDIAQPAMRSHGLDDSGEAAADHIIGAPAKDRFGEAREFLRRVLAVGVAERHDRGASLNRCA